MNRFELKKPAFVLSAIVAILFAGPGFVFAQNDDDSKSKVEIHHHHYGNGYSAPGYTPPAYAPAYSPGYAPAYSPGYLPGYGGGLALHGMTPQLGAGIGAGVEAAGRGQAALDRAKAGLYDAQTDHQSIENHNTAVNSYYANREVHNQYVDAHRRGPVSPEEAAKFAKIAAPGRLSDVQFDRTTNVINWPGLLRDPEFAKSREKLDHLFNDRTPDNSGADSNNYVQTTKTCNEMRDTLGKVLRKEKLPAVTFCAADHFIKSLDYESRFAAK
jgi:hypothetical protein